METGQREIIEVPGGGVAKPGITSCCDGLRIEVKMRCLTRCTGFWEAYSNRASATL